MANSKVQFQVGLSMADFMKRYGTESLCQAALEQSRWPQGFHCQECRYTEASVFFRGERKYWQCCRCRHQTTVVSGTIFQGTKIPLTSWFLAMHLLTQAKNNVSALELKRHLGVSYPTAWLVKHKVMEVMVRCRTSLVAAPRRPRNCKPRFRDWNRGRLSPAVRRKPRNL